LSHQAWGFNSYFCGGRCASPEPLPTSGAAGNSLVDLAKATFLHHNFVFPVRAVFAPKNSPHGLKTGPKQRLSAIVPELYRGPTAMFINVLSFSIIADEFP
jgi:hypothetical protein